MKKVINEFKSRPSKYLLILPFLALPFVYNNCAPASFQQTGPTAESSVGTSGGPSSPNFKTFSTDVIFSQTQSVPLDLIWVIDNSGSMTEEADHVRKNFLSFINALNAAADVQVALISKSGSSGTAVSLPVSGPKYLTINQAVDSTSSALLVAQGLCTSTIKSVCQQAGVSTSAFTSGKLAAFLRPASKKAVIFVTDDESSLSAAKFEMVTAAAYPGQSITKYGFIGLGAGVSPCQAKTGSVYKTLADASGGAVYNICQQDWTQTFTSLKNNVTKLLTRTFPVTNEILTAKIVSVTVNGVALKSSQYSISGGQFEIAKEIADQSMSGRVVITYQLL